MRTLQHKMLRICDQARLGAGVSAPEQKDYRLFTLVQKLYYPVRELLPAHALMTVRLTLTHGENSVQQQHTAVRPGGELSVVRRVVAELRLYLLENVLEGGVPFFTEKHMPCAWPAP